ncbi:MAG: hypothetical protein R3C11_20295 [Planctomycetaceae bacterium]
MMSHSKSRSFLLLNRSFCCGLILAAYLLTTAFSSLSADDPKVSEPAEEKTPLEKYIEEQQNRPIILDEIKIPDLKVSPSEQDNNKKEALAHFLTARILFNRNAHQQALTELQKAADLSPGSSEIYELLIPLAIGLNQSALVEKYVSKAESSDPDNYQLLVRVGRYMQQQNRIDEAIRL